MRMWTRRSFHAAMAALLVGGLLVAAPCASAQKKEKSLYDRLGKKKGITKVVKDFLGNVGGDTRINQFFAKTDLKKLEEHLINQICQAAGGPCKYTGRDMKTAHRGMGVSGADFGALVEDLVKSLDKNKVGEKEKGELLGVLGPMKGDIVERP